jgi:hypothetical protein
MRGWEGFYKRIIKFILQMQKNNVYISFMFLIMIIVTLNIASDNLFRKEVQ